MPTSFIAPLMLCIYRQKKSMFSTAIQASTIIEMNGLTCCPCHGPKFNLAGCLKDDYSDVSKFVVLVEVNHVYLITAL